MKIFIGLLNACLCIIPFYACAQVSLQSYIDTALQNNPVLKVYSFRNQSLEQGIKPSRAWDDPMFFIGLENVPVNFDLNDDEMTMTQIGFQQNFSVGKKYSLKERVAEREFSAGKLNLAAQRILLIYKLKHQYYDLYAIRKSIETTQNSIETMKNLVVVANTRYSTGKGTQQDVLKAQLEVTKMQTELMKMQSEESDMTAIFNSLLLRDKNDSVETSSEISFTPLLLDMKSLHSDAYANNPELLGAQTMIEKDSAEFLLAKASKIPDFNLGGYYGLRQYHFEDGSKAADMFGLMLGFTLPLWSGKKQNPMIAQANYNIQKSQAELDAMTNEIELMIHHSVIDAQKNERLISLYSKQLIPQSSEYLNAGITGYLQNKIDFMKLTDNFLELYNYRLLYHHAVADYMIAISELEMLTGKILIQQ